MKKKTSKSPRKSAKQSTEEQIVPFHEAAVPETKTPSLYSPSTVTLHGDRRIEVWRLIGNDGFAIRIFRPTLDGKTSKLCFGLSEDAARGLCAALQSQLMMA